MTTTLAERLQAARVRGFVGRERETAIFRALLDDASPWLLQYLHGPGGVGKTSWIAYCGLIGSASGVPVIRLDARAVPPEPPRILAALGLLAGDTDPKLARLAQSGTPGVLFIDTFEYWQSLEAWVRDELLPQLPANLRIVICSRRPPSVEWSLDPGWRELMAICELANFSADEAGRYLRGRQVPEARIADAIQFSHGNPLALAMTADLLEQDPLMELTHRADREATRQLVDRFTRESRLPEQRAVLQVAAVALEIDEALIADLLPGSDAAALYGWLAGLSLTSVGQSGLYPHDLVREALMADLVGRHPETYATLARRIFDHEIDALPASLEGGWRAVAVRTARAVFALRAAPGLDGFLVVNMGERMYVDPARPADLPVIEDAILRHEGEAALRIFRHWRATAHAELLVLRDPNREVLGFCCALSLAGSSAAERAADPLVAALWQQLYPDGVGSGGADDLRCWRTWMSIEDHQRSGLLATALLTFCFGYALALPGLAVMSIAVEKSQDYWARFAELVHIERPAALSIEVGAQAWQLWISDWRRASRLDWLKVFARRVTGVAEAAAPAPVSNVPANSTGLHFEQFAAAVHQALQQFHETHALQGNPLLASRMVLSGLPKEAAPGSRLVALRERIRATNRRLAAVETTARAARILHRTYLEPARSQQLAAEALGMSYSSYRRLLAEARELIAAELWQLEQ